MARAVAFAGITLALVGVAAAFAADDVRIHRVHVPPPLELESRAAPPGAHAAPAAPSPASPSAPVEPTPPGTTVEPPSPPPPAGAPCTVTNGGLPVDITGQLIDEALSLAPATLVAPATLRIRGLNVGAEAHTIAIRRPGGAFICGTPVIAPGAGITFAVANLAAGTYEVYCTIHAARMRQTIVLT